MGHWELSSTSPDGEIGRCYSFGNFAIGVYMAQVRTESARPPRIEFDPQSVGWWRARLALTFAAAVAALVAAALVPGLLKVGGTWLLIPAAVVLVVAVPVVWLLPGWWYRVHRWEITDTAVYLRKGYFWQEVRIAPISRIQTVDTVRGPLQKHFGLTTLAVTTASAKGAIKIDGLAPAKAAELTSQLTEVTRSDDAT